MVTTKEAQNIVKQSVNQAIAAVSEAEQAATEGTSDERVLHGKLGQVVQALQQLKAAAPLLAEEEFAAPLELVRAVDGGQNPDLSTRDLFIKGLQANQAAKGKVQAVQGLRDELWKRLQADYPAEASAYALLAAGGEQRRGAAPEAGTGTGP